jgi:hypothetical protein
MPGKGCMIYEHRPTPCRNFFCQWLLDPTLGDEWHPAKSRIIIYPSTEGPGYAVEVDPQRPDRWLGEPYFRVISNMALKFRATTVRVGKRWYSMVPREAAEHPETIKGMWRSHTTSVLPGIVGEILKLSTGEEFVWMEVIPPAAFADAWRAPG